MKMNQFKYLLVGIITFLGTGLFAQSPNLDKDVMVKAFAGEEKVTLRWMPTSDALFDEGILKGYKVTRYTLKEEGRVLTPLESRETEKVVTGSAIKAYTSTKWSSLPNEYEAKDVIRKLLYTNDLDYQNQDGGSLLDAVQGQRHQENRTFTLMMLAEQEMEYAKGLALMVEDFEVTPNHEYAYMVGIDGSDENQGFVSVLYDQKIDLPIPAISSAIGGDKTVTLTWDVADLRKTYSYYNIERSSNGTTFEVVNDEPFIFIGDQEIDVTEAMYTDSIPMNNRDVFYRIVGLSPFGYESKSSDAIKAQGRDPRLDFQMKIDTFYENENGLAFEWSIPAEFSSYMGEFNLLTMTKIDAPALPINTAGLPGGTRKFVVTQPQTDAYYILEGKDKNNYSYRSIAVLAQLKDTIPPAKPLGLAGEIRRDGKVSLTWDENTEADLDGYTILYSNGSDGDYQQLTSGLLQNSNYVGQIDPTFNAEKIYYRVKAADTRFNLSEPSEALELARPDLSPPSAPLLARVLPKLNQIRIAWRLSGSTDVVRYELQRKPGDGTSWTTIKSFTPANAPGDLPLVGGENFPSQYVDSKKLEAKPYNYRLVAEDDAGNLASSSIKTVRPFESQIMGKIKQYGLNVMTVTDLPTIDPTPNGGSGKPQTGIFVHWQYQSFKMSTLKEFKIYRKVEYIGTNSFDSNSESTGKFTVIGTINPDLATVIGDFLGGGGFGYFDVPEKKDSKEEMKITYKIIAYHTDGKYSYFSNEQSINF